MAESSFGHGHSDHVGSFRHLCIPQNITFTQQIYTTVIPQSILCIPQSINTRHDI